MISMVRRVQRAVGQHGLQGRPVDQFHHQVGRLPVGGLPVVIDLRDVLVGQDSGVPRLRLEPGQGLGPLGVTLVQQLDRYRPGQDTVGRAPYLAVPAAADPLVEHEASAEHGSIQGHQRPLPHAAGFNHRAAGMIVL
jgi:hypothetical protein